MLTKFIKVSGGLFIPQRYIIKGKIEQGKP